MALTNCRSVSEYNNNKKNKAKVVLWKGRTTLVFSHPAVSSFGSFGALHIMAVTSPGVHTLLCDGS